MLPDNVFLLVSKSLEYYFAKIDFRSGIFLLQDQHWQQLHIESTRVANSHTFPETKRALEVLGRSALVLRKDFENGGPLEEGLPIFFMQTVYLAAMMAMEIGQGNPDKETQEKIESFIWLLEYLRSRWKVAGKSYCETHSEVTVLTLDKPEIYMEILDAKKAFHDFNSIPVSRTI